MSETGESDVRTLAELRAKIDAIDEAMHRLLVERGTVIDALIRVKGTGSPGAAFRPGREADMMRRLVARHAGGLPLFTAEHIWREIITTFTHLQAPFALFADGSADRDRMRDLARFSFGFSVDFAFEADAAAVVARIADTGADLGLIALEQPAGAGAWWRALGGQSRPRIMALLPFIGAASRPADLPAFVVSPPLADPAPPDVTLIAATSTASAAAIETALDAAVLAIAPTDGTTEVLIAVPAGRAGNDLAATARSHGVALEDLTAVGGFARGISIDAPSTMIYQSRDELGLPR